MAQQIGFNELFNKASFDQGVSELVTVLSKITEEIKQAETAGKGLAQALGTQLKKDIASLSSASNKLSKDIADITAKMNNFKETNIKIDKVTREYQKEVEKLTKELEKLKQAQEKVNNETNKTTSTTSAAKNGFGQVTQALMGVAAGAALVYRGVTTLNNQLRLAVESTIAFEKVMKEVQAVSNATGEELKLLTANANKLGSTTEKTAQQVAEAQKELAKLGFSTPEILLATKAIVDLSTATQEDLVKSAEVAAATIKSFGLDVSELGRVTDVMTKSFVISALDLEKFRESMKLVAPIAANTGVEIETVTASLAKLSDTGISGSLSGTALRNLLSSMADPTEKLVQYIGQYDETLKDGIQSSEDFTRALKVLKQSNIDLETAVSMVDVRARSAFFTLVNYADDVEYLALELKYLNNETEEVAKTMRDSLANDIDIANSAFDSLRRNIVEDYVPSMRTGVQVVTEFIEFIRLLKKEIDDAQTSFEKNEEVIVSWSSILAAAMSSANEDSKNFFEIANDGLKESNDIGRAGEMFDNLFTNVNRIVDEFAKFPDVVKANKLATQELAKEGAKSGEVISYLRSQYQQYADVPINDFLLLVQGNTKKQIQTTYGYITALEAEEKVLTDHIAKLKEESKEKGLSAEKTKILADSEKTLNVITALRLKQEPLLAKIQDDLKKGTKDYNDELGKQLQLKRRLIELENSLFLIVAKTAENQAKFALDEETSFIKKIDLLIKYKDARANTLGIALTNELKAIKISEDSEEEKNLKIEIAYAKHKQELLNLNNTYSNEIKQLNEKRIKEEEQFFDKIKELTVSRLTGDKEAPIERRKKAIEEAKKDFKSQMDLLIKQWKEREKFQEEVDKAEEQKELKKREQRIEAAQQLAQGLSDITRSIFDNQQLARENEMNAIDAWEQERIRMAGDNEEAIAAIEKEAEERRKKVRIEQAKADKKEAIFQILLRTAVGIMGALTSLPPNPILAAVIGATGALQAATVAARPLPQFEKGTNYSPEGRAIVGEAGSELIIDGRTKQARLSPDRASITHLSKGSQVIPAHITQKLLTDPNFDYNGVAEKYLNKSQVIQIEKESIDYSRFGAEVREAIKEIPINQTNFDERGVTNYVVKRNVRLRRLNKRY